MRLRYKHLILFAAAGVAASAQFPDDLQVTLAAPAQQYCHIIQFPQPWTIAPENDRTGDPFDSDFGDYEFRVSGLLGTQFLISGLTEYSGPRSYTTDRYQVDLSNPAVAVRAASRGEWEAGTVVPLTRKSAFPPINGGGVPDEKPAELHGLQFTKTGKLWIQTAFDATRLSPDQAWLVLQSTTPSATAGRAKVFSMCSTLALARRFLH